MAVTSHTLVPALAPAQGLAAFKVSYQRFLYRHRRAKLRRQQAARIATELEAYSDRELAELGLCRGDIPAVARGTFHRS